MAYLDRCTNVHLGYSIADAAIVLMVQRASLISIVLPEDDIFGCLYRQHARCGATSCGTRRALTANGHIDWKLAEERSTVLRAIGDNKSVWAPHFPPYLLQ
jgi:hypothetical protein